MKSRMPCLVGVLCVVLLASALPAVAKNVSLRPMSRNAVETACARAHGSPYGIFDDSTNYGCTSRRGSVDCSPDGATCSGNVSDLLPMPAGSMESVLGVGVAGGPTRIGPKNNRITPVVQP